MFSRTQWNDIIRPELKSNLLCIFLGVIIWFGVFGLCKTASSDAVAGLPRWLSNFFVADMTVGRIADFVLFTLLAMALMRLNELYSFIPQRTVLSFFFSVIVGGVVMCNYANSPGILEALLIVLALYNAFVLQDTRSQLQTFNIGFLIGVLSILNPWGLLAFVPFVYFYYDSNVLSTRSFLGTLTGVFIPVFYYGIYIAATDDIENLPEHFVLYLQVYSLPDDLSRMQIAYMVISLLVLGWAHLHYFLTFHLNVLKQRRMSTLILLLELYVVLIALFTPDGIYSMMTSFFLLSALLIGRFFSLTVPNGKAFYVAFWVFVGATLIYFLSLQI